MKLPPPEKCEKCGSTDNEIIRTRIAEGGFRYRRRKCRSCQRRWNTYETRLNPRRLRLAQPSREVPSPSPAPEPPKKIQAAIYAPSHRPFLQV